MFKRMFQSSLEEAVTEIKNEINKKQDVSSGLVLATREVMKIVNPNVLDLDEMEKKEAEAIMLSAHEIMKQPAFEYILKGLVKEQMESTVMNGHTEEHYLAGRAVIQGINLVREATDRLSQRFLLLGEKDQFNSESIM